VLKFFLNICYFFCFARYLKKINFNAILQNTLQATKEFFFKFVFVFYL